MTRFYRLLLICLTSLVASGALAQIPCIPVVDPITATSWDAHGPVAVCVVPGRADLASAHAYPGIAVSEEFSFWLNNITEIPIAGMAVNVDYFAAAGLVLCEGSLDGLVVDENDRLALPFAGGGSYRPSDPHGPSFFIPVCPNQELDTTGRIYFNSPDQDGDLDVDLSDVATFAADYYGDYDFASDFNWDGEINLADVRYLADAIGARCD